MENKNIAILLEDIEGYIAKCGNSQESLHKLDSWFEKTIKHLQDSYYKKRANFSQDENAKFKNASNKFKFLIGEFLCKTFVSVLDRISIWQHDRSQEFHDWAKNKVVHDIMFKSNFEQKIQNELIVFLDKDVVKNSSMSYFNTFFNNAFATFSSIISKEMQKINVTSTNRLENIAKLKEEVNNEFNRLFKNYGSV